MNREMSNEQLEALICELENYLEDCREALEILSDTETVKALRRSIEQANKGQLIDFEEAERWLEAEHRLRLIVQAYRLYMELTRIVDDILDECGLNLWFAQRDIRYRFTRANTLAGVAYARLFRRLRKAAEGRL